MPAKTIDEVLNDTKIYQILRPKLVMGLPTLTLREAIQIMRAEKAGYMVIADEHSKLIGLFTEREVLMKVLQPGVDLSESVSKYIRTDLHPLSKSDNIQAALDLMFEYNQRHVPLLDEFGQVNGVLSVRTIVNFLAELFPTEVFNLPPRPQIHDTVEGG